MVIHFTDHLGMIFAVAQINQLLREDAMRGDALRESALDRAFGERAGSLDRSLATLGYAPQVQATDLNPYNVRGDIGSARDLRSQLEMDDYIQQLESERNANLRRLQEYQGLLGFSDARGYSPITSGGSPSSLAGISGGALAGLSATGGNPWGAAAGAGLGLLGTL